MASQKKVSKESSEVKGKRRWYELPSYYKKGKRRDGRPNHPDSLEELIERKPNGCWIWRGTVHSMGYPIYKGWLSGRVAVFEFYKRILQDNEKLYGRRLGCHDTLCVNPEHQRIKIMKVRQYGNG